MRAIPCLPASVERWVRPVLLWAGGTLLTATVTVNLLAGPLGIRAGYRHAGPAAVLVVLALAAALLWRWPITALVLLLAVLVVLLTGVGAVLVPDHRVDFGPMVPVDVAVCYLAATRPRRASVAALCLALAVPAGYQVARVLAGGDPHLWMFQTPVLYVVVSAWAIGLSIRKSRQLAAASRARAADRAMTAERLRIARELHDLVAHSVGIIAIQAGVGSRVIGTRPAVAEEALRVIETTSREALSGLRRTLTALRHADPDLAAPDVAPGLADLDRLAAGAADAGVRVTVHRSGAPRPLPPGVDLAAYRIVQEALTNVIRHSGARHCRLDLGYHQTELTIEVVDDGPGRPPSGTDQGFGIVGMRERANLLDGHLEAGPHPDRGFQVAATLPLDAAAATLTAS